MNALDIGWFTKLAQIFNKQIVKGQESVSIGVECVGLLMYCNSIGQAFAMSGEFRVCTLLHHLWLHATVFPCIDKTVI